jgi:hypothetical protein
MQPPYQSTLMMFYDTIMGHILGTVTNLKRNLEANKCKSD